MSNNKHGIIQSKQHLALLQRSPIISVPHLRCIEVPFPRCNMPIGDLPSPFLLSPQKTIGAGGPSLLVATLVTFDATLTRKSDNRWHFFPTQR